MQIEDGQTQEAQEATPASESAPEAATEPAASPDAGDGEGAPAAAPVPVYQPNLTYRARDPMGNRQVEKKFDDWLHPLIKDADTEKKARELHERAYGLDAVKADRERLSSEYGNLRQVVQQHYQPTYEAAQQIAHFRDQKNYPAVFQLLGVDPKEIFNWAYNYAQLDPAARTAQDEASRNGMQAYGAQRQSTVAEQQAMQQAAEFKRRELDMIMRYDNHVASVAAEFDQQHGPGAFTEHVKRTGEYYYRSGKDIPVTDAVQEVLKLIGRATPAQPQAHMQAPQLPGQGQAAPQAQQVVPQAPAKKPVIPSVQGTGTSPVKRVYRSMDDIKKRRKELEADDMAG